MDFADDDGHYSSASTLACLSHLSKSSIARQNFVSQSGFTSKNLPQLCFRELPTDYSYCAIKQHQLIACEACDDFLQFYDVANIHYAIAIVAISFHQSAYYLRNFTYCLARGFIVIIQSFPDLSSQCQQWQSGGDERCSLTGCWGFCHLKDLNVVTLLIIDYLILKWEHLKKCVGGDAKGSF